MKIDFFTQRYNTFNNYQSKYNNKPNISRHKLEFTPITDTVSFTAKKKQEQVTSTTVGDHYEAQLEAQSERYARLATVYLDILESVTNSLKDKGFSMDRAYCEINPVKSAESSRSKVERSKTFDVPDRIRATIYCNDPYNLSSLNDLLIEMEKRQFIVYEKSKMSVKDLMKRGYIPAEEEKIVMEQYSKKNLSATNTIEKLTNMGYNSEELAKFLIEMDKLGHTPTIDDFYEKFTNLNKQVPDLDIRLNDKVASERYKLKPEYRYCISKPQSSGYEDIQIRFVRKYDDKPNPVKHELIILFGPNYAQSKHNESERVYSHLRKFEQMNISSVLKNKNYAKDTKNANLYISLIQKLFKTNVSEKEFENGRNIDYKGTQEHRPISFNKDDIQLFNSYFEILNKEIDKIYDKQLKRANKSRRAHIEANKTKDKELMEEIKKGLKKTIKFYNTENEKK